MSFGETSGIIFYVQPNCTLEAECVAVNQVVSRLEGHPSMSDIRIHKKSWFLWVNLSHYPKNGSYMAIGPFMPFGSTQDGLRPFDKLRIQHERGTTAITRWVRVRSL
ncbi:MAG: hypothetical protein O6840_06425 [Nitrospirae bacterium]|nr:hypothetical protein [Nitrospirota bacterium]